MKVVLNSDIRKIEENAFTKYGVASIAIMENAGSSVAYEIKESNLDTTCFLIVSGTGNNGGDGFVVARHLKNYGYNVTVFVIGNPKNIVGDARLNFDILKKIDIQIENISDQNGIIKFEKMIKKCPFVVDAIFGIGINKDIDGIHSSVIDRINSYSKFVISVDIPSGIDANNAHVYGNAVMANKTVSFTLPKVGNIMFPGSIYSGNLAIKNVGIPIKAVNDENLKYQIITEEFVRKSLNIRDRDSHKGDYGKANVVAGSSGLTGAAILTCKAALRSGLGLLRLYIPESLNTIITLSVPETVTVPLQEMRKGVIGINHINRIIDDSNSGNVLTIGPGCGNTSELSEMIRRSIIDVKVPLVIDADGLNALSKNVKWLLDREGDTVLTPHPGEMSRLTGYSTEEINRDPINIAKKFAMDWKVVMVLKGSRTVIASPKGEVFININGNPGMATAGSGDVLTGIITGFIAQGIDVYKSAILGVYLHGMAGDLMVEKRGEHGLLAGDIVEGLAYALKHMST